MTNPYTNTIQNLEKKLSTKNLEVSIIPAATKMFLIIIQTYNINILSIHNDGDEYINPTEQEHMNHYKIYKL